MPIRHHAQRKHILYSLDILLYQLHTLSFLLSPSLFPFICRCTTQFHFSKTGELGDKGSLRFWFAMVALVNVGSLWAHAFDSGAEGRAIMLDFVGMSHRPSRLLLLLLDFTIIFLQLILTTIAYETSLTLILPPSTPDPLLPPPPSPRTPAAPSRTLAPYGAHTKPPLAPPNPTAPVIDLRARHVLRRLAAPAPPVRGDADGAPALPLPNTTPWRVERALRLLARIRTRRSELEAELGRAQGGRAAPPPPPPPSSPGALPGRIPGALDMEED